MPSNYDEYMKEFMATLYTMANDQSYKDHYERMIAFLDDLRERKGRLFIVGMGGSAANAQHMANDFRKIGGIDTICLSDNIAELTARANDDGLQSIYSRTMKVSNFYWQDILFVLSVSGGNEKKNASMALVNAVIYAKEQGGLVLGIVGMPDSYTQLVGDEVIVTPTPAKYITQIAEALQPVIWHGIVSDSKILQHAAKW